jgi:hypothetical protein
MSLSRSNAVAGTEVTVTGANFVPKANMTISFGSTVVNSTTSDSASPKAVPLAQLTTYSLSQLYRQEPTPLHYLTNMVHLHP